jgi:hypothetical protein
MDKDPGKVIYVFGRQSCTHCVNAKEGLWVDETHCKIHDLEILPYKCCDYQRKT